MSIRRRTANRRKPVKYYSPKRRFIYAQGDAIDHLTLFELHAWTCWICKGPINRRLRMPNYMAATVEHIVPISAGGTHTWNNVACSHARCNFDKGGSVHLAARLSVRPSTGNASFRISE